MKFSRLVLALAVAFSLVTFSACGGQNGSTAKDGKPGKTEAKKEVKRERITDLTHFDLSTFNGKVRMYEMWGVWCRPCLRSMPHVQELWEKYRDNPDFELLVINTGWRGDNLARINQWLDANPQYTFPIYFDPQHKLAQQYGVNSIPRTIIIGKDNRVRFNDHPMRIPPDLLDKLLAE